MARDQDIVELMVSAKDAVTGMRQFDPDQHRHQEADHAEHETVDKVHRADVLVVRGIKITQVTRGLMRVLTFDHVGLAHLIRVLARLHCIPEVSVPGKGHDRVIAG